jgi:hypothetical protein
MRRGSLPRFSKSEEVASFEKNKSKQREVPKKITM